MVGLLGNKVSLSPSEAVISGALSGITTRAVISPFDVVKIRLQLHVGKKQGGRNMGLVNAVSTIFRKEGVRAFWKGHTASQLLSVVYGAVQFGVFTKVSHVVEELFPDRSPDSQPLVSLVSGGVAGMAGSFSSQPLDLVRTRMVMQRHQPTYTSTGGAFLKILQKEGVRGFYRGLIPNLLQVVPSASLQFGAYSSCILLYTKVQAIEKERLSNTESFLFGAVSGVFAKCAVLPFDVTKKRLQVQGFRKVIQEGGLESVPLYKGMAHCVRTVYKHEGILGFYKGALPSLLKAFVSTGTTFMTFNFFSGLVTASRLW